MWKPIERRLRIAQVAPLYESVPPKLYGGTERVVAYLTEEMIRRGHEVTLFASGDSTVSANLEAAQPVALRAAGLAPWGSGLHLPVLSEVCDSAGRFDIIHSHLDYWSFPFARFASTPAVTRPPRYQRAPERLSTIRRLQSFRSVTLSAGRCPS